MFFLFLCGFPAGSLAFLSPMSPLQTNACLVMVFCTHPTAHTAFDTSITQPVESWGCMPFSAGSKSLLQWRAHIPCCYFMTLYGGDLLHVQRRARRTGPQVWWWGRMVCLLPEASDTHWLQHELWMAGFLSQPAYRYCFEPCRIQYATMSLRRSYFVSTWRLMCIISHWPWSLKAYDYILFL